MLNWTVFRDYVRPWYKSYMHGSIMTLISILNVLFLPLMNYYEMSENETGVQLMWNFQFGLNVLYITDLVLSCFVRGIRNVFMHGGIGIKFELLF